LDEAEVPEPGEQIFEISFLRNYLLNCYFLLQLSLWLKNLPQNMGRPLNLAEDFDVDVAPQLLEAEPSAAVSPAFEAQVPVTLVPEAHEASDCLKI
jgi:hypothetical protein